MMCCTHVVVSFFIGSQRPCLLRVRRRPRPRAAGPAQQRRSPSQVKFVYYIVEVQVKSSQARVLHRGGPSQVKFVYYIVEVQVKFVSKSWRSKSSQVRVLHRVEVAQVKSGQVRVLRRGDQVRVLWTIICSLSGVRVRSR